MTKQYVSVIIIQMNRNKTTQKVLDFIAEYGEKNGYAPSFREIADSLGIKSPSTIFYHINKLADAGKIEKDSFKNRTLHVPNRKNDKINNIPVVGKVAAGMPILAVENIFDHLALPDSLFSGKNLFSLQVKGDSMINSGIFDGDIIIVNQQSDAENGEIVVALIEDEATVKTLYKEKNKIRLQPENDNYEPIITSSAVILGKVVGLIRKI